MSKIILLTGANGLLGQKFVELLSFENEDFTLVATSRGACRFELPQNVSYESMDIVDHEDVKRVFEKYKPDFVLHGAAMTNVDQCEDEKEACWDLNVTAVESLVHESQKYNSFFLHVSTDFIFDGENGPYDEEAVAMPLSYYGESKLAAEKIVQNSSLNWAIARTVLVYGVTPEMSRSNIILWVKSSLEQGKVLNIVDDQWRTPTLAEDLAMGCFLILKNKAEGVFNISGEEMLTPYDMAMYTVDYFGLDGSLINKTDGSKFSQRAKRPAKTGFIIEKAQKVLGYQPRTFKEGIAILESQL